MAASYSSDAMGASRQSGPPEILGPWALTCDTHTGGLVAELEVADSADQSQVYQDVPCLWRRHNLTYDRLPCCGTAIEEPK